MTDHMPFPKEIQTHMPAAIRVLAYLANIDFASCPIPTTLAELDALPHKMKPLIGKKCRINGFGRLPYDGEYDALHIMTPVIIDADNQYAIPLSIIMQPDISYICLHYQEADNPHDSHASSAVFTQECIRIGKGLKKQIQHDTIMAELLLTCLNATRVFFEEGSFAQKSVDYEIPKVTAVLAQHADAERQANLPPEAQQVFAKMGTSNPQ